MLKHRVSRRVKLAAAAVLCALLLGACGTGGGSFDAQGLVFDYPAGFQEAEGTDRKTLVLRSDRPEEGVVTVLWREGGQPDAGVLVAKALKALGVDDAAYDDRVLEVIEFADVPGATAHYLEMTIRAPDPAPAYFARLLVLEGANGYGYIIGHTVAAEHRDDDRVVRAWDHLRNSLRFETQNARN